MYSFLMEQGLDGTSKNPHFIPTDGTTSHSTKLSKDDSQVAGYAVLRKKFSYG